MNTPVLPRKPHSRFRNPGLFALLPVNIGLSILVPGASEAATATGGTKTTMSLKYTATGSQWVMRVDPPDGVQEFQLHFQLDPDEVLKGSIPNFRAPFTPVGGTGIVFEIVGNSVQVSGKSTGTILGDVDIFEVIFQGTGSPPGNNILPGSDKNLSEIKFTAFATGNDYLVSRDSVLPNALTRFSAAEIAATSRSAKPGVSPMIWDGDGAFNNGTLGGSGTWDTAAVRFDNLPGGTVGSDVAWSNTVNVHDIAVFGGNGGIVTLGAEISAGGLQFDSSGYALEIGAGTVLTLSRPASSVPTIDTGANSATVNVPLDGSFQKLGSGTLTLGTLGTIAGPAVGATLGTITVKAGSVKTEVVLTDLTDFALLDAYFASPPHTNVTFAGNGAFEYRAENQTPFDAPLIVLAYGALTFSAGDGNVRASQTLVPGGGIQLAGLTFTSLTASPGATGNFIPDFVNGADISVPGPADQILSPRLFLNGADFAARDSGGFVRALAYGTDANTVATNSLTPGNHVNLNFAFVPVFNSTAWRTLRLGGNTTFGLAVGATLTLTEGGLLKAGGVSTIFGGAGSGITTGGSTELIVRTDLPTDELTISTSILSSSTGGLTKSGLGMLTLSGTNGYTGPTIVNDGKLLVTGSVISPIALLPEATLGGTGSVGVISGGGTVSPGGNAALPGLGAGILTAVSLDARKETDLQFDVGQTGALYDPSNDLLRLTDPTAPFAVPLCATSRIAFDFQLGSLTNGLTFLGGFFTAVDATPFLQGAAVVATLNNVRVPDGFGVTFNQMVPTSINFGAGLVSGFAAEFRVISPKVITVDNGPWATGTNWFTPGIPTNTDNAVIAATGTIDIRGSNLGGSTEVQDLSFTGMANTTLINNSTSTNMVLNLNGERSANVPLIHTNANVLYTITGTNAAATPRTLTLQLLAGGEFRVEGTGQLDISAVIQESGGAFGLTKTGDGTLILRAANTFSGGVNVNAGILQVSAANALGTGAVVVNGGSLALQNLAIANQVTFNGGTILTRSGDASNFTGTVAINGSTTAVLRSFSTIINDQSITISGPLSGAADLTIDGNASNAASGKAFILTNPANTYSGTFHVSTAQTLRSAPAATGSALGGSAIQLNGGTLQLRDNGAGNNGVLAYGNNVLVQTAASTVSVDRVSANSGNTFALGTLSIGAQTLRSTGANGYGVRFGATTLTGAATFETDTAPLMLDGVVSGGFGLTKTGASDLILANSNTYTGSTQVNAGRLVLNGSIGGSPRINVKSGGTLDVTTTAGGFTLGGTQILSGDGAVTGAVTVASGGRVEGGDAFGAGTLTMTSLTLGNTATLVVSPGASVLPINVTGVNGLVANGGAGSVAVNISGIAPALGTHVLVDYAGIIGGVGFGGFTLGTLPPRTTATMVDDGVNTSINLDVTSVDSAIWKGALSSEWSTAILAAPKNWVLASNSFLTTDFITNDSVTFNDSATATTVNVSVADVLVAAMTFDNTTTNYTINGPNAITGATGLVKNGTGSVTINNTNGFTGTVQVNAGTVSVPAVANSGVNSPLGAGNAIGLDGGTLEFTGASGITNRPVTLGAAGGTFVNPPGSALTLSGAISGSVLTKSGAGNVILTNATNTYTTTTISAGTLQIGDSAGNGSLGTGAVTNNATLAFNNPAAQTITNEILGSGALIKTGAGILVLSGAVANSYAGTTTVSSGNLILSKTSGIDAIGGNLVVEAGGTVSYGTTGGQLQDHIPDTASITINGGTFGSGAGNTQAAPTAGVTDTVSNVTVISGSFLSGRGPGATPTPFTVTGQFQLIGGTALVSRGGGLTATAVQVASPAVLNLDGGSGTAGQQSRLGVGAGGLTLTGATINFNAGPSAVGAGSVGSVVTLNGNVTSAGTSSFARLNPAMSSAIVDLAAAGRTFDVTGTLTIAPDLGAATDLATGGIQKTGPGKLVLEGAQNYASLTNDAGRTDVLKAIGTGTSTVTANAGTINLGASQTLASLVIADGAVVTLTDPLPPAPALSDASGAPDMPAGILNGDAGGDDALLLSGQSPGAAVPEPGALSLLLLGALALLHRGRRNLAIGLRQGSNSPRRLN